MCGIAGYIGRRPPSDLAVDACLARMRHRGPDAQGVYRHAFRDDWHACMIHARLSIIDLKYRPEPLQRDGCAIAFNGEGYKSLYKTAATFFEGVRELPSGRWLRLSPDRRPEEQSYWQPEPREAAGMSFAEAVTGTRERLIESVRLRLRADVPMAFCMSGGVDSNSLISIAKRVFGYDVHGFTIVNTDSRYEERERSEEHTSELQSPDHIV